MGLKIVYMGTPDFAVPALYALIRAGHEIPLVVTQPDRPAGRGGKVRMPPVKKLALDYRIPVAQPERLKKDEGLGIIEEIRSMNPDVIVVAAYGQILPQSVLSIPRLGCVNIHASLLPRWRGASPIQKAVQAGDRETGVTMMLMDEGLDTGFMLTQEKTLIGPNETAGSLHDRLAQLGAQSILSTLRGLADGTILPEPQPKEGVTYASLLKKRDGIIDWSKSAQSIHDHIRAMTPWPGAQSHLGTTPLKIGGTILPSQGEAEQGAPGTVHRIGPEGAWVCTGSGSIVVQKVQPAGKKMMSFRDYLRGHKISLPARFGSF